MCGFVSLSISILLLLLFCRFVQFAPIKITFFSLSVYSSTEMNEKKKMMKGKRKNTHCTAVHRLLLQMVNTVQPSSND